MVFALRVNPREVLPRFWSADREAGIGQTNRFREPITFLLLHPDFAIVTCQSTVQNHGQRRQIFCLNLSLEGRHGNM